MMKRLENKEKGAALMFVLGTVLVLTVLANLALSLFLNQSRLTHHQVRRIQAYYASLAGVNYGFEMLRRGLANGGWAPPGAVPTRWCIFSTNTLECAAVPAANRIQDVNFPPSIRSILITVTSCITGTAGCPTGITITAQTNYTNPG